MTMKLKTQKIKIIFFKLFNNLLILISVCKATEHNARPNIVIIMADDLGFDDISFRGSNEFLTPNIDALAFSGVILNNFYTPAMCTPSRAALMTGKYPINTGMQHYVIANDQPWGLPLNETTIAEIFRKNGYTTSLIGKWHLGMSRQNYTPTFRGFDKHFGYLGAYIDYYEQTLFEPAKNYTKGHDFRNNLKVSREYIGRYVTELLTEASVNQINAHNFTEQPLFMLLSQLAPHAANDEAPLQAPPEEIAKFSHIKDVKRRTYAAMVSMLDKSVGQVIDALNRKNVLQNTIILFLSDNGGPTKGMHSTTASNYPLRGQKNSPWEGGLRSSAAIWSTQIEKLGIVWQQKMYIADLLPTLAAAANIHLEPTLNLDGLNLWSALKYGYESLEREIVHNIDDIFNYVAYTKGKWKFVNGTTMNGTYDGWLGTRTADNTSQDMRTWAYEQHIRNTNVWQQLAIYNTQHNQTNITSLRAAATINCQQKSNVTCNPLLAPCFFDIEQDACETQNLYEQYKNTKIFNEILARIRQFRLNAHAPLNKPTDPKCNPKYNDNEWTWWQDMRENANSGNANRQSICSIFLVITFVYLFNKCLFNFKLHFSFIY